MSKVVGFLEGQADKVMYKKYVSLNEGMELYSLGMATFRKLAEEAGAVYKVNKRVLVNTVEFEQNLQKYRM